MDPVCVGDQKKNNRDECYRLVETDGMHVYDFITQRVLRISKGSTGVSTSGGGFDEDEDMGWVPVGNDYYIGAKKQPSISWKDFTDKDGNATGKQCAEFLYGFYHDGDKTTIRAHQLGQLMLRNLGGHSRGPFMRAYLDALGYEGLTVDEAFPITGRGDQTRVYACNHDIPLEEQSEIPDVDHCGPRHIWKFNSIWYTFSTNHSRNTRFTTTRNGDKYPGNGTNDFNFAHLIMEWITSAHLPSSKIVKDSK